MDSPDFRNIVGDERRKFHKLDFIKNDSKVSHISEDHNDVIQWDSVQVKVIKIFKLLRYPLSLVNCEIILVK